LPIDGAEGEWLRDQWHKEKKKKAAAAAKVMPGGPAAGVIVMGVATKTIVENPNKAVERIRKENAAWLKSTEEAKEKAPLLAAASLKDKEAKPGAAGCDKDLLAKVHKALKDTKDVNYGLAHPAIACSNTPGHNGLEKDPILKGLLGHMKSEPASQPASQLATLSTCPAFLFFPSSCSSRSSLPLAEPNDLSAYRTYRPVALPLPPTERPDPQKIYLEKLLKIPPAGTPAAAITKEADAIADIRKRNQVTRLHSPQLFPGWLTRACASLHITGWGVFTR
jgi:hypothetical protein